MLASNSVSTIFKCMSCSFGTRDHTTYAEHIKHCSSESISEAFSATSDDGNHAQNTLSKTTKKHQTSHVCKECLLPMDCSRSLLLHMRDVHDENMRIFICRLCPRYAARCKSGVYRHAKSKHPEGMLRGRVSTELRKTCVTSGPSAKSEAAADKRDTSEVQESSFNQNESGILDSGQYPAMSSRSLGLQFLGKQLPDIGHEEYICRLCNFSHIVSHFVVKHIWTNHKDEFSGFVAEASTRQATDDGGVTNVLYKCDDCSYSTRTKLNFYDHCAHHQFEGRSKCRHCSYCALTNAAIVKHTQKYHDVKCLKVDPAAQSPKTIGTVTSASRKNAKRSCSNSYKKRYAQQQRKQRWFTCPHCPFKSTWRSSVYHHKAHAHAELRNASSSRLSAKVTSPSHKLKKTETDDAADTSSSCDTAEQLKSPNDSFLVATSTPRKQKVYTCDICSAKCKSLKYFYVHRQIHLDLRRYQCPHCPLRSNYRANLHKHLANMHRNEKKTVPIKLSVEDAKKTIEEYRKQSTNAAPRRRKRAFSSTKARRRLLRSASYHKSRAVRKSVSTPRHHVSANISEHNYSLLPVKQERKDNSDASDSCSGTDVPSLWQCFECSVCKIQSNHRSSIHRHIRNKHRGRKARVIVLDEIKSKLALRRRAAKRKLNAESSDDCSKLSKEDGEQNCQQTVDKRGHDESSAAELGIENTVKSEVHTTPEKDGSLLHTAEDASVSNNAPMQPSPTKHKALRRYTYKCDICPYSANSYSSMVGHRKLHVKRSGYDFACNICPYFACQSAHLERHMQLHAKLSGDIVKKPCEKLDLRAHAKQSGNVAKKACQKPELRAHLCEHCPFLTGSRAALIWHRQLHRPRASALYKCDHCAFWVAEPYHLYKHARVHTTEYLQKRTKYRPLPSTLPPTSSSVDGDGAESVSAKHPAISSHLSASGKTRETDGSPAKKTTTSDKGKPEEMTRNKSVSNADASTGVVSGESGAAVAEGNAGSSARSNSAAAHRQLPLWCCERCPYSANKLACFKRHAWLHDQQCPYECCYCDYSVQSYWQLVSHMLWHFAPNKHLIYAQSVSNLDSFPSRLPNRDSIPESLASIDRFIPSFENSDALLSDAANFQCDQCPFVTEQRSQFFAHMVCHSKRTAAYSCPYCSFRTDQQERLSTHVFLHFNLPGCRQSCLPPNVCHSEDWKQLCKAIEAVTERNGCGAESHCELTHNWSHHHAESSDLLKADSAAVENEAARPSDFRYDPAIAKSPVLGVVRNEDGNTLTAVSDAQSASADKQHAGMTAVSGDSSVAADSATSILTNATNFCCYCDKVIDDRGTLIKHEAGHLVGFNRP